MKRLGYLLLALAVLSGVAAGAEEDPGKKVPELFLLQELEITETELKSNIETPNMTVIKPEVLLQGLGTTLTAP